MPICKTCSWWINDCMKTLRAIYSLYCCLGPSGVSSSLPLLCSLSTWICRENLKMTKSKDCKTLVRDTDLKFLRAFFAKSFTGGGGSLKLATAVAFTSCSALICRTAAAVFIWRKHWLVDFVYLRTFCICIFYIWYTGMSYLISLNIMLFKYIVAHVGSLKHLRIWRTIKNFKKWLLSLLDHDKHKRSWRS